MNAGYVSAWLLSVAAILIMTGWRKPLTDDLRVFTILLFVIGEFIFIQFNLMISVRILLNLGVVWAAVWSIGCFVRNPVRKNVLYLIAGCTMIGSVWFWMRKIYILDPVFTLLHPDWDAALASGLLAGVFTPRFKEQFAVLSLSILLGEGLLIVSMPAAVYPYKLGTAWWYDSWVVSIVVARCVGALSTAIGRMKSRWRLGRLQDGGGTM